jgi:hypothetical protein
LHSRGRVAGDGPAHEILADAMIFPSLADALADCTWVVGTTRRKGKRREGVINPRQMAAEIAERQRADQRLQQYAERLEILHEIDRAILDAQSLEASAQTVVHHLHEFLPCERVSVTLLDFNLSRW